MTRPWLHRTHPQMFIVYTAVMVFHALVALGALIDDGGWDAPSLIHARTFASQGWWGLGFMTPAVIMLAGLFRPSFFVAKTGLLFGFFVCGMRSFFLLWAQIDGISVGGGQWAWLLISVFQMGIMLEPPTNPLTGLRK